MKSKKKSTDSTKSRDVSPEYSLNLGDYVEDVKLFIVSLREDYQRHKRKLLLVILLIPLLFLGTFVHVIRESLPDNEYLYRIKRAQEKLILDSRTSPSSRASYYEELLDNRLRELKYVGKNNLGPYIAIASSRYSTTLGELSDLIIQNNLSDQRKRVTEQLPGYKREIKIVHDSLFLKYDVIPTMDQRWHLQRAMDSSDLFIEKLKATDK